MSSSSSSFDPTQCKCGLPLITLTSWTRRFGVYPNKYKKGIKKCKRWHWCDPDLEIKWYRNQLYEMHLLLNPSQREELENELTSREVLAVLQVEFAYMEGQMLQLMEEMKNSQNNACFWKSTVIVPTNFRANLQALVLSHAYNVQLQATASTSFCWKVHMLAELPFVSA
ncbi:hypothetical protein Tco_0821523 [Tanacetum coccineum]|uniref:Uncharacterized protein n=1 Tax=Tanacetum coccineum TaxID=301880 RepID=A0ABQ5AHA6_9ASTR